MAWPDLPDDPGMRKPAKKRKAKKGAATKKRPSAKRPAAKKSKKVRRRRAERPKGTKATAAKPRTAIPESRATAGPRLPDPVRKAVPPATFRSMHRRSGWPDQPKQWIRHSGARWWPWIVGEHEIVALRGTKDPSQARTITEFVRKGGPIPA